MSKSEIKYAKILVVLAAILLTVTPLGLAFSKTTVSDDLVSASTTIEDSQVPLAGDIAIDGVTIEDEQVPEAGPTGYHTSSVLLATVVTIIILAGGTTAMVIASRKE